MFKLGVPPKVYNTCTVYFNRNAECALSTRHKLKGGRSMQGRRENHTILALNCISLVIINSSNNVNEQNVGASFQVE